MGKYYYYYYSKTQEMSFASNMQKLGEGIYKPKKVLYNGKWHPYTQKSIIDKLVNEDSIEVAKGVDLVTRD